MLVHSSSVLESWHNGALFDVPWFMRPQLYPVRPLWWKYVECYCNLTVSTPRDLAYYTNLVFDEHRAAAWHVAAIEFVTMALVHFLHAGQRGFVGIRSYEAQLSHEGCGLLVCLSIVVRRRDYHCGFASLVVDVLLIPPLRFSHTASHQKSTGSLLILCTVDFHAEFPTGVYKELLKAVLPSLNKDASGALVYE